MALTIPDQVQRWIERVANGRVVSVAVLPGATSSLMHAIEVESEDGLRNLVLRRFANEEWVKEEPDIAAHEAMSLTRATLAELPAPKLVAVDADGSLCGMPATLVTRLVGKVVLEPTDWRVWLRGLAETVAQIHRVDASEFPWSYRRYNSGEVLTVPTWSERPKAWKQAIEIVGRGRHTYKECFIHRDYHPCNVIWRNGRVSGVVDWVNACRGPPGIDVAWCRHDLAVLHGVAVADEFLSAYVAAAADDFEYDPYWDLMSVVELLPGPPSIYEGWRASGATHLSEALVRERNDQYVVSVIARF